MNTAHKLKTPDLPLLDRAHAFIEQCYSKAYGASVTCHYPELLVVTDETGEVRAAAGIRGPEERFFLEHYLDSPAEVIVSDTFNCPVPRDQLVEVGSLAGGADHRATAALMHTLWRSLVDRGYGVLLVTATRPLLHRFRHLPLQKLAPANPARVPGARKWGTYYENQPAVIAGRLHQYDSRFRVPLPQGLRVEHFRTEAVA